MLANCKKSLRQNSHRDLALRNKALRINRSGEDDKKNNNHISHGGNPVSLRFHDVSLRMSDVQLLHGPRSLNDQIIGFYYEYLVHQKYKNNNDIYFIAPEYTECMMYMDESQLQILFADQNVAKKSFIFFALSEKRQAEAGGSYWSLLVFSRPEKTFFHFDSYGNNNTSTSMDLMMQVKEVLGVRQAKFRAMRSLRQRNGYDCGLHVLCMTDHVADQVNRYEVVDGLPQLHYDKVKSKRAELLKLILFLGGKE